MKHRLKAILTALLLISSGVSEADNGQTITPKPEYLLPKIKKSEFDAGSLSLQCDNNLIEFLADRNVIHKLEPFEAIHEIAQSESRHFSVLLVYTLTRIRERIREYEFSRVITISPKSNGSWEVQTVLIKGSPPLNEGEYVSHIISMAEDGKSATFAVARMRDAKTEASERSITLKPLLQSGP